jgi:hypothetical protein
MAAAVELWFFILTVIVPGPIPGPGDHALRLDVGMFPSQAQCEVVREQVNLMYAREWTKAMCQRRLP